MTASLQFGTLAYFLVLYPVAMCFVCLLFVVCHVSERREIARE